MKNEEEVEEVEETCWSKKTPLQMGLILSLIVLIPFMIVMIAVYILFAFAWFRSEECEKLCRVMTSGLRISSHLDPFLVPGWDVVDRRPSLEIPGINYFFNYARENATPFNESDYYFYDEYYDEKLANWGRMKKRSITLELDQQHFPSIAALLENFYFDEENEKMVKCAVAILSGKWALTTASCVKGCTKLQSLSVRVNSDYWSSGGVVVGVKNLVRFQHLALIEFSDPLTKFVPVDISNLAKPHEGVSFIWQGGLGRSLKMRKKFEKIAEVPVKIFKHSGAGFPKDQDQCLENDSPVIYGNELIGFQTQVDCRNNGFRILKVFEYRDWLKSVLGVQ